MISLTYKPYFLPQVSAPYSIMLQKLDDEGIDYEISEIFPKDGDDIGVSQGVTFSNMISEVNVDDLNPIWISDDGNKKKICDGHHRYIKGLIEQKPLKAIILKKPFNDACRILNKIQDIYEYEQSLGTENLDEIEAQDAINYYGDNANQREFDFLNELEDDNGLVNTTKNNQSIIGYRKEPIREKSVVGNFFMLEPMKGYDKYQIDFENLLDTNDIGVDYKDGQEPVVVLSKYWFPNIDFENISKKYGVPSNNLRNKAVAIKAIKLGYDGIKYGNKIIQGLK